MDFLEIVISQPILVRSAANLKLKLIIEFGPFLSACSPFYDAPALLEGQLKIVLLLLLLVLLLILLTPVAAKL